MMQCPKCHGLLEDDGTCSCGYGVRARQRRLEQAPAKPSDGFTGQSCAFNDHGRDCTYRGVLSTTTNGSGQWYCREHWEVINHRVPEGKGNYLPAKKKTPSPWDGWKYNSYTKRLEKEIDLSQFDDVLPETEQV